MTKPWRVDILECRGSSYDVGKQTAEVFSNDARPSLRSPQGAASFAFSLKNPKPR